MSRRDESSPVLVTGLHAGDNPSPGLGVARCLVAGGRRVVGACYDATETGAYASRVFSTVLRMPRPEGNEERYLVHLERVVRATGVRSIVPTLDPEVLFLARHQHRILAMGLGCLLPNQTSMERARKQALAALDGVAGFRVPPIYAAYSLRQARRQARELGLPLVLRGAWYEAHVIRYQDELPAVFRALRERWGLPVLLQPRVLGPELVVACLCDRPGHMVRSISMRKLGMSDQGTTWCGLTFRNQQLDEACRELLRILAWEGACEVEAKLHEPSGMLTLLELNTRLPSWIGIAAALGSNLPLDLVRLSEGEDIGPDPGYSTGQVMVRQHLDQTVPLARLIGLEAKGKLHVVP